MKLEEAGIKKTIGNLLTKLFVPLCVLDSIAWAAKYVRVGLEVSTIKTGKFNALVFPAIEYLYNCLDNPYIPIIYCMKSARFGWTTATIVWLSKVICEWPRSVLFAFGTKEAGNSFYKVQWLPFIQGIPRLMKTINPGLSQSRISWNVTTYPGGTLKFISTRISTNYKSTNSGVALIEEPDNHDTEMLGEGDLISLLLERMKTIPIVLRKLIVGGTATIEGVSRIAQLITYSNHMIFKAECHECKSLIPMNHTFFEHFRWEVFPDHKEHKQFGKYNPDSVKWYCPECQAEWTFEQKNLNILAGKKHGFTDHTGTFSKGWHPENPDVKDIFGFIGSECLSPLPGSNFIELSKKILAAKFALEKGNESLMIAVYNNMYGIPYRTSRLPISEELLANFYSTFAPGIAPYEGLVPYLGIDVQRNRLAFTICVYGEGNNCYVVDWFELFGDVLTFDSLLWQEAASLVRKGVQHITGQTLFYNGVVIDCQDGITSQYVYAWSATLISEGYPIFCVRGVNNLNLSTSAIFELPSSLNLNSSMKEKTLADSYGITPYKMGTHACQSEVMKCLENNTVKLPDGKYKTEERLLFTRYEREDFLAQMTSCVLVPSKYQGVTMYKFELKSGKRMEALACVKMCYWAATKDGIFLYTEREWEALRRQLI